MMEQKIAFAGAGNMGGAILRGLLSTGKDPKDILFFEPFDKAAKALEDLGAVRYTDFGKMANDAHVVFLCVKPQVFKAVASEWSASAKSKVKSQPVIISIMAGVARKKILEILDFEHGDVVRVMPNLPLTVGKGAIAIAQDGISQESAKLAEALLSTVGATVKVSENLIDAVTGLSGSAPAYVFEFIEGLVRGGVKMGLSRHVAMELTLATIEGSIELLKKSGKDTGELAAMVSSPAGTTIAGVQVLEDAGFRGILMHTVETATKRSQELGK
ncbi:MAG: pyrroline-5-carboxylate reductase [Fibrobacteraceae bacterium]|nr:pyrroline-5-carboxylate reductase [Fibrobacteraceae bacterium]